MDDRRFDTIARNLASGTSRRAVLTGLLGLVGIAAAGGDVHHADAARRGFSSPRFRPAPFCSSDYDCSGGDAVCCVGDCCAPGQSCVTTPNNTAYCT